MRKNRAAFSSMQTRLQARHGDRPTASDWSHLESSDDLANYLQLARRSPLRPWVIGLHDSFGAHEMELSLNQHLREYINNVASWMPGKEWSHLIRLCAQLLDLPTVHYLQQGQDIPSWLRDDPALRTFVEGSQSAREEAIRSSPYSWLTNNTDASPVALWLHHWQKQWPPAYQQGLQAVVDVVETHRTATLATEDIPALERQLTALFRRYAFEPAAAVSHLALVALDLERLRGALTVRAVLPPLRETA